MKNAISVQVTIPANTKAHVYVPTAGNGDEILVVDGVETEAKREEQYLVAALGSGTHKLTVKAESTANIEKKRIAAFTFDDEESGFSGEGAKGTNSGKVVLSDDAVYGKALSLDGSNSNYVKVTDTEGKFLLKGADELTVSYWSKSTNSGNNDWAFYAAGNDNAQVVNKENYIGIKDRTERILAERYNSIGARPEQVAKAQTSNSDWKYVTVTYSADATVIYVNGERVAEDTNNYALEDILGADGVVYIGKANWGTGEYYKGLIDEFSIYNYAMTTEEAKKLYKSAKPVHPQCIAQFTFDNTTSGFTSDTAKAVNTGAVELTADAVSGKALYFDGSGNNYLKVTDKDGNPLLTDCKTLTVSYWSKLSKTGQNSDWAFFAAPSDSAQTYNNEEYLGIKDSTKQVKAERFKNTGKRPAGAAVTETFSGWKYVTVVFDENQTSVYINGEKKQTAESTYSLTDILGENSILYIGKANWGTGEYFTGLIDEMSIYNYALTDKEIADIYTTGADTIDKNAVNVVKDLIGQLGEASTDPAYKTRLDAARAAYDALSEEQKAKIDEETYKKLTDAELAYNTAISTADDAKAAQVVIQLISNIGTVSLSDSCRDLIIAAEIAYGVLTDTQKELVSDYDTLLEARKEYDKLLAEKEAEDKKDNGGTVKDPEPDKDKDKDKNTQPDVKPTETVTNDAEAKAAEEAKNAAQAGTVSSEQSQQTIVAANTDKGDVKGSTFAGFKLKTTPRNTSMKLSWSKVKGAEGYFVYGASCGQKMKCLGEVTGNKKSYTVKKLKKGTYYKYMLTAYKTIYGEKRIIATSVSAHCTTKGGKYGNPTAVVFEKKTVSVKKNKTFKLKPELKCDKKMKTHIAKFRYESSNPSIATVNKSGKIKGKKKGKCDIYIYAQNGLYKKIKVTVK